MGPYYKYTVVVIPLRLESKICGNQELILTLAIKEKINQLNFKVPIDVLIAVLSRNSPNPNPIKRLHT